MATPCYLCVSAMEDNASWFTYIRYFTIYFLFLIDHSVCSNMIFLWNTYMVLCTLLVQISVANVHDRLINFKNNIMAQYHIVSTYMPLYICFIMHNFIIECPEQRKGRNV